MSEKLINFRSGVQSAAPWFNFLTTQNTLLDIGEGWGIFYLVAPGNELSASSTGTMPSGNASWVNTIEAATAGHGVSDKVDWAQVRIQGPANTDFSFECYCRGPSGRITEMRLNGGTSQSLANFDNYTSTVTFSGSTDGNGDALFEYKADDASTGWSYINAARLVEVASASITLSAAPKLGAVLSGTGSNYAAQPTGPISITQGARSLPDMPITVSAWDAGTGSFNWTTNAALPGFPANGADTTPFVLTGEDVTITLPDPGV